MKVDVLGVKIDAITQREALSKVEHWVWNPGKYYIVTPNPEFIVTAQKDPVFKKILNGADLSIPDGVGLRLTGKIKNTFSGTDFMEELVELAAEKGFTVGFLGGKEGVAVKCSECLKQKYSNLKISFASSNTTYKIPPTDLLFIALGHGKQEKWIKGNINQVPAKVFMGVGGAFDYLSGSVPRAPKGLRDLGLEWLFRLVIQPWRIKRQLALFEYLWLIIVRGN